MKITLAPDAERQLGIAVASATAASGIRSLATFGEIVIPPLSDGGLPITSMTDLATLSANQARADGDVARAAALARAADLNLSRAEALVREQAGSVKARDDALAAAAAGRADLEAARRQRGILGASVASLGRQGALWVRVSVVAGDLARIDRGGTAAIGVSSDSPAIAMARPVKAPPSANGAAGSVDLYYAVPSRSFQLGQRVAVELPTRERVAASITVPASAVVYDIHGGEWVYVRVAPHSYERRRVQVARLGRDTATLAKGLGGNDPIVTAGAAELFGTEFGTK